MYVKDKGSTSWFCRIRRITTASVTVMVFTNNAIVGSSFNLFPWFSDKVVSADVFHGNTNSLYTCLSLCLFHVGCSIVFYENATSYCSGGDERDMGMFLRNLIVRNGTKSYRLDSECDSAGYVLNRETGQCLKIVPEKKNWHDAQQYCEDDGGALVMFETPEKTAGLRHMSFFYNGKSRSFFVGVTDIASEGVWTWLDGTLLQTQDINTKFNNANLKDAVNTSADCGAFNPKLFLLFDAKCSAKLHFICERRN